MRDGIRKRLGYHPGALPLTPIGLPPQTPRGGNPDGFPPAPPSGLFQWDIYWLTTGVRDGI